MRLPCIHSKCNTSARPVWRLRNRGRVLNAGQCPDENLLPFGKTKYPFFFEPNHTLRTGFRTGGWEPRHDIPPPPASGARKTAYQPGCAASKTAARRPAISCSDEKFPVRALQFPVPLRWGIRPQAIRIAAHFRVSQYRNGPKFAKFPVNFPVFRESIASIGICAYDSPSRVGRVLILRAQCRGGGPTPPSLKTGGRSAFSHQPRRIRIFLRQGCDRDLYGQVSVNGDRGKMIVVVIAALAAYAISEGAGAAEHKCDPVTDDGWSVVAERETLSQIDGLPYQSGTD